MNDFLVTLYKSDNTYLTYPVNGKITILETGTDGRIIRAVFQKNDGGPVVIDHPDFEYPAEQRARWFSEYGDIQNAAIAAAVQAERGRCIETALNCFFDLTDTSTMSAPEVIKRTRHGIAAAIRARSNAAEPVALFDDAAMSDEDADMLEAEQEFEAAEFFGIKPAKPKRSSRARNGAGRE